MDSKLTLAACCALLAVCSAAGAAEPTLVIRGDHASTRAFAADAARLYQLKRGVATRVEATGTVGAIESVSGGTVDVVVSARAGADGIESEQSLRFTPVAWDALAVIVYPGNPVQSISLEQLRDVLIGKITDWRDLGGKPGKINLYAVATPTDGVEYSARRLLLGAGSAATSAARWYLNTERLEEAVTIDPAGFAISLYSDIADNKALRALALEGVAPSPEAVTSGQYLLTTPLYVVTRQDATPAASAGKFLEFMDEREERANLRSHHLIPVSEAADVSEAEGPRERFLADRLGYARPAIAALPPAPTPTKVQPTNLSRLAQADVLHPPAPKQPAAKGTALPRASAVAAETEKPHDECLEQALCT